MNATDWSWTHCAGPRFARQPTFIGLRSPLRVQCQFGSDQVKVVGSTKPNGLAIIGPTRDESATPRFAGTKRQPFAACFRRQRVLVANINRERVQRATGSGRGHLLPLHYEAETAGSVVQVP